MHCLLLGNGLNRLSQQLDWQNLLEQLASNLGIAERVAILAEKPLSLQFEELCAQIGGNFGAAERTVKRQIASLLHNSVATDLHREFAAAFEVILTTNYDFTLEEAVVGSFYDRVQEITETRYSLFRKVLAGSKEVWHIHGDTVHPETILLGFDHYAGFLQKIRNYLTTGIKIAGKVEPIRSPLKSGAQEFESSGWTHSWVDHFLRDHLHIVGLGLDFTEIDLWWLILHKRRRKTQTGYTFYYCIAIDGEEKPREASQVSVLRSLGVEVVSISAATYQQGYRRVLDAVRGKIAAHREWRVRPGPLPTPEPSPPEDRESDPRPKQTELRLQRKRRKRGRKDKPHA